MFPSVRAVCFAFLLLALPVDAPAEDFAAALHAYLQQCVQADGITAGIVVGMVDEHGGRVVGYGKLDNGSDQDVDGDTVFEIGSVTKTFTALLLQDMIQRGRMKLDDPVALYLPAPATMPTRGGRQITLLELATHTSGLPREPGNLDPQNAANPYADYTPVKLYAFLAGYKLTRDPGAAWEYSNLGFGLLGDAIALNAKANFESLVVDRICNPLRMDDTRITLSPELKARFAMGHDRLGRRAPGRDFGDLAGCGALRSTANDMLKYLSANLGLTPSTLTPLMQKTHLVQYRQASGLDMGLAWWLSDRYGTKIIWHGGDTDAYLTFVGLDEARHRGVVVLANYRADVVNIGNFLLNSEWQTDRRPTESIIDSRLYAAYAGQYQRASDLAWGIPRLRHILLNAPRAPLYLPAVFCVALLAALPRRRAGRRKRPILLGGAILLSGTLAALVALASSRVVGAHADSGLGIRRVGDRLFAQVAGWSYWPVDAVLPPGAGELAPESPTRFFERLSGIPTFTFTADTHGKVNSLTVDYRGRAYPYVKVSTGP
jgi:CubicO group peptidase (beta-lactamase class C family)